MGLRFVILCLAVGFTAREIHAKTITVSGNTSAAINSAIASASSGDTVYIPAGSYSISSSIAPKSGITITGAGATTTLNYTGTALNPIFSCNNLAGLTVSNLIVSGNSNAMAMDGMIASNTSNLTVSGVTFQNFVSTSAFGPFGVYCSQAVTNSNITNCTFTNIGTAAQYGGAIRFSNGSSFNQAINNTIANTGRGGIFGDDGSVNNPSTHLIIENNTISGSGGEGMSIEVQDCPDALIQANKVDHYISVDSSSNSAVRNNIVSDTSGTYKFTGLELVNSSDVTFTGNTVNGGAQIGISESNGATGQSSSREYFAHNTIIAPSTWGIQVQGDAGGITDQYFYANNFLSAQGTNPIQFASPAGLGFRFNANAQNIVLKSNLISGNASSGVYLAGSNLNQLAFLNNTITGNSGPAISLNGSNPSDVEWSGNTITGNTSNNSLTQTRSPSLDPSLSLSTPAVYVAGSTVNFSIGFADGSSTLAHALWDFGDGLPLATTSSSASHEFDLAGDYTIGVVAWDANGRAAQAETTIDIVVSEVPEPAQVGILLIAILLLARFRRAANF